MAWINCLNTALQITASNKNAQNLISIATALQAWERSRICPSHVLFCTNVPCSLFSGLHIHCTNRKQTLSMHTVNVWNNTYKYLFLHTAVINMFDFKLFWLSICSDLLACGYWFWSISKKLLCSLEGGLMMHVSVFHFLSFLSKHYLYSVVLTSDFEFKKFILSKNPRCTQSLGQTSSFRSTIWENSHFKWWYYMYK